MQVRFFFVKAVSILYLSFTLSNFHISSPTLLHEYSLLDFHMPKEWPEMNMDFDLDLNLAAF